jgi:hypothetical protein
MKLHTMKLQAPPPKGRTTAELCSSGNGTRNQPHQHLTAPLYRRGTASARQHTHLDAGLHHLCFAVEALGALIGTFRVISKSSRVAAIREGC